MKSWLIYNYVANYKYNLLYNIFFFTKINNEVNAFSYILQNFILIGLLTNFTMFEIIALFKSISLFPV